MYKKLLLAGLLLLPVFAKAQDRSRHAPNSLRPDFPQKPEGLVITPPIQNIGPHANYFRDPETGKILKGDHAGKTVGTFSAHRSPLGLFFDRNREESVLAEQYRGDGFVIGYSSMTGGMSRDFGGAEFGEHDAPKQSIIQLFLLW